MEIPIAGEGASGADRSDSDKSSDNSSKADRAEREMSDKSREALSADNKNKAPAEATAEDRAASQERMAAVGQSAKDRVEAEAVDASDVPDTQDQATGGLDSSGNTPEDQAADAEEGVDAAEVAAAGTYADSYLSQALSGVNEGIANVLGGPVDLVEGGLNLAMDAAEALGVPESITPEFENSFLGSDHINAMMTDMGSIGPESVDPTKQTVRDIAEIGTEVASVIAGGATVAGRTMTSKVDDVADIGDDAARRAESAVDWVDESASMSSRARDYDAGATGARSNIDTKTRQAPALERTLEDGATRKVRFDGVDDGVMVDRKLSVVTTQKAQNQALRQSEALKEQGLTGRWEVPTDAQARRAEKMFEQLGVDNIDVRVVPE